MLIKLISIQQELHSFSKNHKLFHQKIQCQSKMVSTYQERLRPLEVSVNRILLSLLPEESHHLYWQRVAFRLLVLMLTVTHILCSLKTLSKTNFVHLRINTSLKLVQLQLLGGKILQAEVANRQAQIFSKLHQTRT